MSHNIFGGKGFAEIQGNRRQRAWHKIGITVDSNEKLSCIELAEKAQILYRVGKFPIVTAIPKKDGQEFMVIPNQKALIREESPLDNEKRFFGLVTDNYTIIQNRTIAEMLDKISNWHPETVGALGFGEKIFFALAAGDFDIAGDQIQEYFLCTDTKDGTGGMTFCYTPIRVVCQNTLTMGLNDATNKISLTHSKIIKQEAQELISIYEHLQKIKSNGEMSLKKLTEIKFNDITAKDMISIIYPEPEKPKKLQLAESVDGLNTKLLSAGRAAYENEKENTRIFRSKVTDLYDIFNDSFPRTAGTGYALYNSIVEHEDFYKKGKDVQTTAESALYGTRAQTKSLAFDLISKG